MKSKKSDDWKVFKKRKEENWKILICNLRKIQMKLG